MAIKVGDRLPNATFMTMTADGPKPQTTDEIFKGKKVVLFAVRQGSCCRPASTFGCGAACTCVPTSTTSRS